MKTLRETVGEFRAAGKALGHFNFSDSNQLKAIAEASREANLPIIAGLSSGEQEYFSPLEGRALVDAYIQEGFNIYLNADHTYDLEKAKKAIDAGVDSIVIDGAKLPILENIALVKSVVAYARATGRDILVEGELGYIGTSSKMHDEIPEGVVLENLTTVEDAKRFVSEAGMDCLAPAIGNIHGVLKNAKEPRLHPDRVGEIAAAVGIPLVLHGASGNTEEDIRACIKAGITIVHINTELRVAYRDALKDTLDKTEETTPYKFLAPAEQKMKEFLVQKIRLFANL